MPRRFSSVLFLLILNCSVTRAQDIRGKVEVDSEETTHKIIEIPTKDKSSRLLVIPLDDDEVEGDEMSLVAAGAGHDDQDAPMNSVPKSSDREKRSGGRQSGDNSIKSKRIRKRRAAVVVQQGMPPSSRNRRKRRSVDVASSSDMSGSSLSSNSSEIKMLIDKSWKSGEKPHNKHAKIISVQGDQDKRRKRKRCAEWQRKQANATKGGKLVKQKHANEDADANSAAKDMKMEDRRKGLKLHQSEHQDQSSSSSDYSYVYSYDNMHPSLSEKEMEELKDCSKYDMDFDSIDRSFYVDYNDDANYNGTYDDGSYDYNSNDSESSSDEYYDGDNDVSKKSYYYYYDDGQLYDDNDEHSGYGYHNRKRTTTTRRNKWKSTRKPGNNGYLLAFSKDDLAQSNDDAESLEGLKENDKIPASVQRLLMQKLSRSHGAQQQNNSRVLILNVDAPKNASIKELLNARVRQGDVKLYRQRHDEVAESQEQHAYSLMKMKSDEK